MARVFICSKHKVACVWKPGGVKKDGTPYRGFYACPEMDEDGSFCKAEKIEQPTMTPTTPIARPTVNTSVNEDPVAKARELKIAREAALHAVSRISEPRKDLRVAVTEMIDAADVLVHYIYHGKKTVVSAEEPIEEEDLTDLPF